MEQMGARQTERTERIVRLAEITTGTRVVNETGMEGTVTQVIPAAAGNAGGVHVAWSDGSGMLLPLTDLTWRADVLAVRATRTQVVGETSRATTYEMARSDETLTVPVIEEQLVADTVWREAGVVRLRVHGETAPQTLTHEIERDEVSVEEVNVGRELAAGEEIGPRQEGDVWIIPVIEEQAVMVTRRMLIREVRVTRRTTRQTRTVEGTTRRTVVEIDTANLGDRVHLTEGAAPDITRQ